MKEGEQYDLDMVLMKIREKKRKRKIRSERIAILFVVWLLVFKVFGIMRVSGNSMRPAAIRGVSCSSCGSSRTAWTTAMWSS